MAAKPLTTEAIALTEKKMDMTLDDIIKMSKKPTNKDKKSPRQSNKGHGFLNGIASQRGTKVQRFMDSRSSIRQGVLAQRRSKFHGNQFPLTNNAARRAAFMPARNMTATPRNVTAIPARGMTAMPVRNMAANWNNKPRFAHVNAQRKAADGGVAVKDTSVANQKQQRPQTMDALFANMKEKRMVVFSSQRESYQDNNHARFHGRQQQQQTRGGFRGGVFPGRRFGSKNNNSIR